MNPILPSLTPADTRNLISELAFGPPPQPAVPNQPLAPQQGSIIGQQPIIGTTPITSTFSTLNKQPTLVANPKRRTTQSLDYPSLRQAPTNTRLKSCLKSCLKKSDSLANSTDIAPEDPSIRQHVITSLQQWQNETTDSNNEARNAAAQTILQTYDLNLKELSLFDLNLSTLPFEALSHLTQLERINLSHNPLGKAGPGHNPSAQIIGLSQWLSNNSQLRDLHLDSVQLGNGGNAALEALGQAIGSLTALTSLSLMNNPFLATGQAAAEGLQKGLSTFTARPSLTQLLLSPQDFNGTPRLQLMNLAKTMARIPSLRYVRLQGKPDCPIHIRQKDDRIHLAKAFYTRANRPLDSQKTNFTAEQRATPPATPPSTLTRKPSYDSLSAMSESSKV